MLKLSEIARSIYYYYLHKKDADKYEKIKIEITKIFILYKGEIDKIADNLLKRDFNADKPFEKLTFLS